MNKKAIYLFIVFVLLASLQLACSFSDLLGNLGQEADQSASQVSIPQGNHPSQSGEDQESSSNDESDQGDSHPAADQSNCTKSFTGSMNISEGQEFEDGDIVQVIFTLINTGNCTWDTGYSLINVGGDLSPSSNSLSISSEVAPGNSIQLQVYYIAPSQVGSYLSVWKMQDADGGVFGLGDPPDAPLRIKIRIVPSGSPQPIPNSQVSGDQFTMLKDECFDFSSDSVVDCTDSSADFMYNPNHPVFGELTRYNDNAFGENHTNEPDVNICQNDSYAPMPHFIEVNEYLCFKIETLASTTYGWMRVTHYNDDGLTFDFDLLGSGPPLVTTVPNTNLFLETQGQQITLTEGQCYDVWNGEKNLDCSGTFAGFLFEEVTKKSMQVSQISPNEMQFSAAMSSEPTKSECMSASYSSTPIWPIQATSYYCYQFVPGSNAYYGWLQPTSFNLGGLTFDYLTWESSQ